MRLLRHLPRPFRAWLSERLARLSDWVREVSERVRPTYPSLAGDGLVSEAIVKALRKNHPKSLENFQRNSQLLARLQGGKRNGS